MTIYKLAYRKDPIDSKDKNFSDLYPKLGNPVSYSNQYNIPIYTPVNNQLSTSSCVGNATTSALEILQGVKNCNNVKQLSRLFVYYNARVKINEQNQDGGCIIRDCFSSLSTLGVCFEKTWNFDLNNVLKHPSLDAYKEANDNKITGYYRISASGNLRSDMIEQAIRANHPVVFGSLLSSEFMNCFNKSDYPVFDTPSHTLGRSCPINLWCSFCK